MLTNEISVEVIYLNIFMFSNSFIKKIERMSKFLGKSNFDIIKKTCPTEDGHYLFQVFDTVAK